MNVISEFEAYLRKRNYSDRYIQQLINNTERIIENFGDSITLDGLRQVCGENQTAQENTIFKLGECFGSLGG